MRKEVKLTTTNNLDRNLFTVISGNAEDDEKEEEQEEQ